MKCYYDFHIHSALSPCADDDNTPCNLVNMAYLKGLDVIAITDHNTVGNVKAAMQVGKAVGVTVLAGMEIETSEEVHVLSLFPSLEAAEEAEKVVKAHLPPIKNQPEVFGNQFYMDGEDNIVGMEPQLLITATTLDIYKVFDLVRSCGGAAIPAHVDRHSYSVLSNLGFIPPDLPVTAVELSRHVDEVQRYLKNTGLEQFQVLQNSDAHNLADIAERVHYMDVFEHSATRILENFM